MPWSINDVEKHKAGLNPKQKKKWVAIANSVLKGCLKDKGKNCDAMAIKIANIKCTESKRILK